MHRRWVGLVAAALSAFGAAPALAEAPPAPGADRAALCADPAAACGQLVSPACLNRVGAGAIPKLPGVEAPDCDKQLEVYGRCLGKVAEQCGQPKVEQRENRDPRRELASLGVQWTDENFYKAMSEGDFRALKLFVEGGKRLTGIRARFWVRPVTRSFEYFRGDVAKFMLEQKAIDTDGLCYNDRNDFSVYRRMTVSWARDVEMRGEVVKQLCYTQATLDELDKRLASGRLTARQQDEASRLRAHIAKNLVAAD